MPESLRRLVVAIDGPAGAGKSTTARLLAQRLGYELVDTGAIYRTLALLAKQRGISWSDGPAVAALAVGLGISFHLQGEQNRTLLDSVDISSEIRTPEISDGASRVSALPEVRAALLDLQRRLGAAGGVVVEGRDIGTVVFPDAAAKFFLTASAEERARRRVSELRAAGRTVDEAQTKADMAARDQRDSSRATAPLRKADDALEIDSSAMAIDEVVSRMADVVWQRSR
ncbi:MAG TPA: (d)CMP kinase [Polyangia bacterium]|nr:(d)CMP kinase [Polyangia bacterium]